MRGDNTILFIIIAVVLGHFIVGIAYLIYKIYGKKNK